MPTTIGTHARPFDERLSRAVIDAVRGVTWSPWAVLLVCFDDDPEELPALGGYERLFTTAGSGTLNMVDFFSDMSHGTLDLSGSAVFGWFRLPAHRGDYVGNVYPQPPGKLNRNGLLDLARATATTAGIPLGDYTGVVVSGLGSVDLCGWVGGMAALCDSASLQPSLLGQEMGHGYGLDHARRQGSPGDYEDPWDVMSTAAWPAMEADDPEYVKVGPGLNAWNMRSRGWLDEGRVWTGDPSASWEATVELRPLHDRRLPGNLAAEVGPYLVEFRVPEKWDAAIPRACVLVHRFADNHSYLQTGVSGIQDLVQGDRFAVGVAEADIVEYDEVEVLRIDPGSRTATVCLRHRPRVRRPIADGIFGTLLGGVAVDGGGGILVNGRLHKVPPRGPAQDLVTEFARYLATDLTGDIGAAQLTRRSALSRVVAAAAALLAEGEAVSEAPPGYRLEQQG